MSKYQPYDWPVRKSGKKQQQKENLAKTPPQSNNLVNTPQSDITLKTCQINNSNADEDNSNALKPRIQLIIKNCPELFKYEKGFKINSNPIEVLGLKWYLQVKKEEEGFLGLYLHAKPLDGVKDKYRVEINCHFSISNSIAGNGKKLMKAKPMIGMVYDDEHYAENGHCACWGFRKMAKIEDLLDLNKGFMTPDGTIEVWADFMVIQ